MLVVVCCWLFAVDCFVLLIVGSRCLAVVGDVFTC